MVTNKIITIVGLGGIGGNLCHLFKRQHPEIFLVGVDADVVEERNIGRQVYTSSDLGKSKAQALAESKIGIDRALNSWFREAARDPVVLGSGFVFGCVDNVQARKEILQFSDEAGMPVIITGNETTSAQAFVYHPAWKDGKNDPRKIFPVLAEKESDEERHPCAAADSKPQTLMANMAAAVFAMYLYSAYSGMQGRAISKFFPVMHSGDLGAFKTSYYKETKKK